jgi:DNA end-binding protein Ku
MWMGTLSFGLVSVPVKLYSAVTRKTVHFHQIHTLDSGRIHQKHVCSLDGEEIPLGEIVRGYEIAPDRYVPVETRELVALEPLFTRTIQVEDFVALGEIDPIYFDHPYHLVPGLGGAHAYRLLQRAMSDTDKVAIGRMVMRSKERLVASIAEPFDIDKYQDIFREAVLDLVDRKAAGEPLPLGSGAEPPPDSPDVMKALEASLEKVGSG